MKIILLQPPIQDFYDTDIRLQPLGLCMLKAAVRRAFPEVDVKVMDFHHGQGKRQIPLPPELSYLKEYYAWPDSGPLSTFHRYMHFGVPFEEVGRQVAAEAPDLVGISSLFSPYHREAARCAREIKLRIDAPIVMGGPHVTACPKEVLSDLNLSLVSADKESLAKMNRPHTPEKFEAVVKEAHGLGFRIVAYQIIGLSFEPLEKMIQTMAILARLPVLIGASIFYLAPGSPMAREVGTPGEVDCFKARSTAMAVESPHFARDDLYTLFITARILNFLKGLRVEHNGLSLKEALQFAGENKRGRTGADLLTRLLAENRLYAATSQGLKPLPRFRAGLFLRVLNETKTPRTLQGYDIRNSL